MQKSKNKSVMFACFSPPVMIATFFIEIFLAIYVLTSRKFSKITGLIALLLVCLAIFQLAEYGICEKWGIGSDLWAKIGFVSITLLPPLGLHLVQLIAKKKVFYFTEIGYALAAVWIGIFIFGGVLQGSVCSGNYVIFTIPDRYELSYYVYYNVLLFAAIATALYYGTKSKKSNQRIALQATAVGYLSFIIPSMFFSFFDGHSGPDSNLPSIMCGFAVLLALILALKVTPLSTEKK